MTDTTDDTDHTLPRATVEPAPLDGEPTTDRAFLCKEDGRTYRIRLAPIVGAGGDAVVIPFLHAFDLTVVRLDADGTPERNAADQVVIVANTRWTVDQEAVTGALSLDAQLDMLVANLIHTARLAAAAPAALDAMVAGWAKAN